MIKESIVDLYLTSNKKLFPLRENSKKPTPYAKEWVTKQFSDEFIKSHRGNLAWAIGKNHIVIDVDVKNNGVRSFERLIQYIKKFDKSFEVLPCVLTPSGGRHYYMFLPFIYQGKNFRKNLKDYPGIDFLSYGTYCVIPGSCIDIDDNKVYYKLYENIFEELVEYECPLSLLKLLKYEDKGVNLGDFDGLIGGSSINWPVEKVDKMLSKLDPGMGHDEWVRIGMALHNWDPLNGFEVWKEWSEQSDKYDESVIQAKWKSFSVGGGISLGTVNHMVKEVVFTEEQEKVEAYIERIQYANERSIHFDIVTKIRNEDFDKMNREKIVKALKDRIKELTGVAMPIRAVRELIQRYDDDTGKFIDEDQPNWCKDWLYINTHGAFLNIPTMRLHKTESFNIENGIYIPFSDGGTKPSATKYVADKGFVKKVDTIGYLPTYEGLICTVDGTTVVNTFNKNTVPQESSEYTKEGLEAIEFMKKHFMFLCGNQINYEIFMNWMAHQIQYPGKQVLWSVVIQSIQGVGKSYCGEVLRLCLGDKNVGTVSPTQAVSQFNSWAMGVCVNVMEELRVAGHNRYECVNALKPLITDRIIMINEKGVKQFMTYNNTNYIIFTNYKDAIPLEVDDRRFWVIFVDIQSLSELEDLVGMPKEKYFPKLFSSCREYYDEIRKYFLEYKISEDFMNMKQAPMTDYKEMMISTEESNHYGLDELRELIEEGSYYYNVDAISSADLFDDFLFRYPDITIDNYKKGLLLKRLGYTKLPKIVKLDGKSRKIWAKKPLTALQVRMLLKGDGQYIDDF